MGMTAMKHYTLPGALAQLILLTTILTTSSTPAYAYEVTDKLSVNGILAAAYQCQILSDDSVADDTCRAAMPVQPEITYRPNAQSEFYFKFGFAAGNGLNPYSPFIPPAWAADLEEDVININGRERDYLLNAWYKYSFDFSDNGTLGATFGIVDAADYLDGNAYASDEYTQFMNAALTNAPNVFFPSYDIGGALEWERNQWLISAVIMDIGENDDGNSYTFYGVQAGVTIDTQWGEGHYRVMVDGTNDRFLDVNGNNLESRNALMFNFDQTLGKALGAFLRFGWQTDRAAVDYKAIYSGGIDIKGSAWDRSDDNIGIGYAYVDGANLDVKHSHVGEVYYRAVLNEQFALSGDIQYMHDSLRSNPDPKGLILGLRMTTEF
jgi:hypothetical protein